MTRLKLGPILEDKPVKVSIDLPGSLHRDLVAYAEALARKRPGGSRSKRLIVPMLERFIATDRGSPKRAESASDRDPDHGTARSDQPPRTLARALCRQTRG